VDRPDFFSDVRTRRAFANCMDRQEVVDTVFMGQAKVLNGYLPPQHPLHNPEIREYDFDVEAGRALLEEVGWVDEDGDPGTPRTAQGVANIPDGTPLVVTYETVPLSVREQAAALLQNSLAECGIQANTQFYLPSDFFAGGPEGKLFGRDFDLVQFAWVTGVPPLCDLYLSSSIPGPRGEAWVSVQDGKEREFGIGGWGGQNYPGFVDEDYDRACNKALNSLPGQAEYEAAHLEAQRIFAEQLPVLPLYVYPVVTAYRPDLCGLIMDPSNESELWNIEEFDYGEGCEE
jgi:peptide/nickel transport system substrate-binding protein